MTVFLFFDESGNLDFSPNGTRYFAFGALTTRDPANLLRPLSDLRYRLIGSGVELEAFHASEDKQAVRDEVYQILTNAGGFEVDAVVVEKRKVNPDLYDEVRFYPQFANDLLKHVFARYTIPLSESLSSQTHPPVHRKRKAVEKAFEQFIRGNLGQRPFTILHHSSASHACLQAADYCTWAIY